MSHALLKISHSELMCIVLEKIAFSAVEYFFRKVFFLDKTFFTPGACYLPAVQPPVRICRTFISVLNVTNFIFPAVHCLFLLNTR